jgi:hypothetical protein
MASPGLPRLAGACLILFILGGAAHAQEEPPGEALTSEELRTLHAGRSMRGCYVNRRDDHVWSEHMAEDGRLYDLEKDSALVGSWWIDEGGVICFFYTDRPPGPYCYTGRRRGSYFDYYSAPTGALSATTDCGDAPVA